MPTHSPTVGLVIPTLNAGAGWPACLKAVRDQTLQPDRLLIVDSASTDSTVSQARDAGFDVVSIKRSEFNHGGTRQRAAELLDDCDVIIFLTQDAIPAQPTAFACLVESFVDPGVAVAYGRQLPRAGATLIEAHARLFNYGAKAIKKNLSSLSQSGTKVFFCSNSFAAYRRQLLVGLGGFNSDLILGEDMEFAARAVKAGYTNVYCADAVVFHSHDYSIAQTFSRYFDLGVFEAENRWMSEEFGSHRGEGKRFVKSELAYLAKRGPFQLPRAIVQTLAKFLGYRAGRSHHYFGNTIKRKISMHANYWK